VNKCQFILIDKPSQMTLFYQFYFIMQGTSRFMTIKWRWKI